MALDELAQQLNDEDIRSVALRFATVCLEEKAKGWAFHPLLGFWKKISLCGANLIECGCRYSAYSILCRTGSLEI